ncbi:unnamed protein product [Caenorhabditis auriculariae]|uniref:Uncharacterized protein n=1 Tax=Caenorhabditis auriculariae TaxID=2777116 RepID=A0A8S1HFI3_9PELO|nr:unnamed protein product [Caenorhabditis auriculariae]
MTDHESPFKRKSSFRRLLTSSLRRSKRFFSRNNFPDDIPEEGSETVFLVRGASVENLRVVGHYNYDHVFTSKPIEPPRECPMVRYFPKEGKSYDKTCQLHSFERKRRSHQLFGADHHAMEALFCPLQASQVELEFKSVAQHETIIRIHAPSGETSPYLYPNSHRTASFTPTAAGCGHGNWIVEIAIRTGCRFKHIATETLNLKGHGLREYIIQTDYTLAQGERLWIDHVN